MFLHDEQDEDNAQLISQQLRRKALTRWNRVFREKAFAHRIQANESLREMKKKKISSKMCSTISRDVIHYFVALEREDPMVESR